MWVIRLGNEETYFLDSEQKKEKEEKFQSSESEPVVHKECCCRDLCLKFRRSCTFINIHTLIDWINIHKLQKKIYGADEATQHRLVRQDKLFSDVDVLILCKLKNHVTKKVSVTW